VALVVLKAGNLDESSIPALRAHIPLLERRLAQEYDQYRNKGERPFAFRVFGPQEVTSIPPQNPGDTYVSLARFNYDLWRYFRRVNASIGIDPGGYDAVVYVVARPPKNSRTTSVEGVSQRGGWLGVVEVELSPNMADYALFVAAHELFHILGAEDKYDATGQPLVPQGLGDPALAPLYPQRHAEVMARLVAIAPGRGRAPESLDELEVGMQTATEIGWVSNADKTK